MSKYALQIEFETKDQAEECYQWFDGAGEQDWWVWAEYREAEGKPKGFGNFKGTKVIELCRVQPGG